MALLGRAAMLFWHDLAEGAEADFHHWHSHEHLPERVGVPGFRRGRRAVAPRGRPRFLTLYEVESLATLTSPAYLARLNDPTPWTARTLATFRNSNRTLCRVAASFGQGVGGWIASLRLSPALGRAEELKAALSRQSLPGLLQGPGLVGAHLLQGDERSSRGETAEKRLRDRPDEIADWVVLVEGYEAGALAALREAALSAESLEALGAAPGQAWGIYQVIHLLGESDLSGPA